MIVENEDRIAEREARRWLLAGNVISTQSAKMIASWWHGGQWTRAYSIASTGQVPLDADRSDFISDEDYTGLYGLDKTCIDALMAWVRDEKIVQHEGEQA